MPNRVLLEANTFKELALQGATPENAIVRKGFLPEIKGINYDERTVDFIISTGAVDRDNDVVDPNGWDLTDYKKNPVVLFGHDYRSLPVGRGLNTRMENGKLKSTAQFPDVSTYAFADTVFKLIAGGYLNATSVGFDPTKWEFVEEASRGFGVDFKQQKLLEYSIVPVPANPEALIEARSKGINTRPLAEWADEMLSGKQPGLCVPKTYLEQIRKASTAPLVQVQTPKEKIMDEKQLKELLEGLTGVTQQLKRVADAQEVAKEKPAAEEIPAAIKDFVAEAIAAAQVKAQPAKEEKSQEDKLKELVIAAVKDAVTQETGQVS